MKIKEMKKLTLHFDYYFKQSDSIVCHPTVDTGLHIDVLLYSPNEAYPFWKLVTMGASDFKMPAPKHAGFGNRNEYIMFVDKDEELTCESVVLKYIKYLIEIASYPYMENKYITYTHSMEWEPYENEEMVGAFIELPQVLESIQSLHCKLSLFKTVTCLQVVLLNRQELDKLLEIGAQSFSYFLYPDSDEKPHFLCEIKRTDKF